MLCKHNFHFQRNLHRSDEDRRTWPFRAESSKHGDGRYYLSGDIRMVELNLENESTINLTFSRLSTLLTGEWIYSSLCSFC